jgi:hypothetical protein
VSTVAAQLTGILFDEDVRLYPHNLYVIFVVVLTFMLDIVLAGFLVLLYHIPCMTCIFTKAYEGKYQSHFLEYEFAHIVKIGGICVI